MYPIHSLTHTVMAHYTLHLLLLTQTLFHTIEAADYRITNSALTTAGGIRYNTEITIPYTNQTLQTATEFIHKIFHQTKDVHKVFLFIETLTKDDIAYTYDGNEIYLNADYVGNYSGDVKREVTGILLHEMTHVWQWDGNGEANSGLIEGIADYVRLKANYAPSHWVENGEGSRWDQGYDVTARFLDYCNGLRPGFVAELNRKMKSCYCTCFFDDLLGKSVDELWKDYKKKYGE